VIVAYLCLFDYVVIRSILGSRFFYITNVAVCRMEHKSNKNNSLLFSIPFFYLVSEPNLVPGLFVFLVRVRVFFASLPCLCVPKSCWLCD
jgi:hypothetical protein